MAGDLFVVQGDITQLQADAIVYSTSVHLEGGGASTAAFAARFKEFLPAYKEEGDRRRQADQLPVNVGDAFWIPLAAPKGRLQGIVVVAAAGFGPIPAKAEQAVRGALRQARRELLAAAAPATGNPWLIALPAIGHGHGGYSRELLQATRAMVRAARQEIQDPVARQVDGKDVRVETDVAFVPFTPLSYQAFLEARRCEGCEPPNPFDTPDTTEQLAAAQRLLASVREGRCVLFAGAGLSKPAGLRDWDGLLRKMADELGLKQDLGKYPIDFSLDLAQWYVEQRGRAELAKVIQGEFGDTAGQSPAVRPTLNHYFLASLPLRLFLTTNYDDLLERTLTAVRRDPEVIRQPEDVVRTGQFERPCVVKLHGDASHEDNIVLTRDDFDGFFRNHPVTAALFQGLLLNQTFLFVGYGLRDPNTRQMYSHVAHLLHKEKSNRQACTLSIQDEDETSRFYEKQWANQGLITLRMPGPDRLHNSLRFFDWLAREAGAAPGLFLQWHLQEDQLPRGLQGLDALRASLFEVVRALKDALAGLSGPVPPERTRLLAQVLHLTTALGWRPEVAQNEWRLWEALANSCADDLEKKRLLRRALRAAETERALDHLRRQLGE